MRRHRRRYIPSKLIVIILLLVFGMGIGYAAISTTLNIDGTSDIDSASWDVHFANVQVTSGSVSATTPAISNNTSVSFSANLANPGDFYEFKIDVVNAGTFDAKLDAITILPTLTQAQQNYFKYTVTYDDGIAIEQNDGLLAGQTLTLLIRAEYLTQTDTSLYPTDDVSFDFSVSMTYTQGHGNVKREVFHITDGFLERVTLNQPIKSSIVLYDNPQDIINNATNPSPVFFKNTLKGDIIKNAYIGFEYDGNIYYLKGWGSEYNPNLRNDCTIDNGICYENDTNYSNNVQLLKQLVGDDNCIDIQNGDIQNGDIQNGKVCEDSLLYVALLTDGEMWVWPKGQVNIGYICSNVLEMQYSD